MTPPHSEPWRSKKYLADHYDYSTRTIGRWMAAGCPSRMIGGERRFRVSDVDVWLSEQDNATQVAA